jgi:DNA mismatch repair protein MutH
MNEADTDFGSLPHELAPPRSLEELKARAAWLSGREVAELEGTALGPMLRRKGKLGQLIERILGATAGSLSAPDFPELGVELKTIPLDALGRPRESTFVCSLSLADADTAEWASSAARAKLCHVLWVPVLVDEPSIRLGTPWFWTPTPAQEAVLRADFDDIMGMIAIGKVEDLTARVGRWLQARPKAAHSGVRTRAYGAGDEPLAALPRGFYLRTSFTGALQKDPATLKGAE